MPRLRASQPGTPLFGIDVSGFEIMMRGFGARIAVAAVFLALAPSLAWSYIDPGNGAYMVQLMFTLVGAALFYIRHPVRAFQAVRNWIFKRDPAPIESDGDTAAPETHLSPAATENAARPAD